MSASNRTPYTSHLARPAFTGYNPRRTASADRTKTLPTECNLLRSPARAGPLDSLTHHDLRLAVRVLCLSDSVLKLVTHSIANSEHKKTLQLCNCNSCLRNESITTYNSDHKPKGKVCQGALFGTTSIHSCTLGSETTLQLRHCNSCLRNLRFIF